MLRLKDKNGTLMTYRTQFNGAVLSKGKRNVYLIFKTSNQGKKARQLVANNSFNKLFQKGRKVKTLGSNVSYIRIS